MPVENAARLGPPHGGRAGGAAGKLLPLRHGGVPGLFRPLSRAAVDAAGRGGPDRALSLENGIFWVEHGGQRYLAVCEPIYDAELSDAAKAEGRVVRDFIFFDPAACAIPLFESAWNYPGMAALVKSEDALLRALWKRFPGYLRARGAAPACVPAAPGPGETDFLREPVFPGP